MEDRETARMRKYGESKTTRIMMATVPNVTSGLGLRKFQADGFLLTRVYINEFITNKLHNRSHLSTHGRRGHALAQCATCRKVAGSIPDGVDNFSLI